MTRDVRGSDRLVRFLSPLFTALTDRFLGQILRTVLLTNIITTRGDRLFISLLGSAYIFLAWLGLVGPNLWGALAISLVYAAAVFRWV